MNIKVNNTAKIRKIKPLLYGLFQFNTNITIINKDGSECIINPTTFSKIVASISKTSNENIIRNSIKTIATNLGIHMNLTVPFLFLILNPPFKAWIYIYLV